MLNFHHSHYSLFIIIIIIMTQSDQPKPPTTAIIRQNGLSSASSRASVTDTPVSRQIWWTQVVDGWPQVRLHSCEGRSPSSSWCRFGGSDLPVHHFEVWRHEQRDPVFLILYSIFLTLSTIQALLVYLLSAYSQQSFCNSKPLAVHKHNTNTVTCTAM